MEKELRLTELFDYLKYAEIEIKTKKIQKQFKIFDSGLLLLMYETLEEELIKRKVIKKAKI